MTAPAPEPIDACDRCLALSVLTLHLAKVPRFSGRQKVVDEAGDGPGPPTTPDPGPSAPTDPGALARLAIDVSRERADSIAHSLRGWSAERDRQAASRAHLTVACRCSSTYPAGLEQLHDPPAVLYVRGDARLLSRCPSQAAGMVGTRRPTRTGREVARRLAGGIAARGGVVVSGMALGIDGAAHEGALAAGAPTIAVLASGADRATPSSHRQLYDQILDAGAVVSEMPPGSRPFLWSFPARNRIIAALSAVTIVVEAPQKSGALITAEQAIDLGRDVLAVPGSVAHDTSVGTNLLLQEGAAGAVVDADHAAGSLALGRPPVGAAPCPSPVPAGPGAAIRAALVLRPATVAELERRTASDVGPAELEDALLELELGGIVERGPHGHYRLVA